MLKKKKKSKIYSVVFQSLTSNLAPYYWPLYGGGYTNNSPNKWQKQVLIHTHTLSWQSAQGWGTSPKTLAEQKPTSVSLHPRVSPATHIKGTTPPKYSDIQRKACRKMYSHRQSPTSHRLLTEHIISLSQSDFFTNPGRTGSVWAEVIHFCLFDFCPGLPPSCFCPPGSSLVSGCALMSPAKKTCEAQFCSSSLPVVPLLSLFWLTASWSQHRWCAFMSRWVCCFGVCLCTRHTQVLPAALPILWLPLPQPYSTRWDSQTESLTAGTKPPPSSAKKRR